MSDFIGFNRAGVRDSPAHRVYVKSAWTADWGDPVPWLHCEAVAWHAQPTVNSALLSFGYGHGRRPGDGGFAKIERFADLDRQFVKIEIDPINIGAADETLVWYGTIEAEGNDIGGVISNADVIASSGRQTLPAIGLEDHLRNERIASARFAGVGGVEHDIGRGIAFNPNGLPNRSAIRGGLGAYVFAGDRTTASYWSSLDIVEYLISYHPPRNAAGVSIGTWALSAPGGISPIPTWDRPVVEADRHTVLSLLNRLLSRQRLLSWYVSANDAGFITINPFTFAVDPVNLASGKQIPANPTQARIDISAPDVHATVKTSAIDVVDQVVVYGARRRTCFTVSFDDATLDIGWTAALKTLYDTGASTADDYPASEELEERRQRNAEARTADLLRSVYARFVVSPEVLFQAGDGTGESELVPAAPRDEDPALAFPFYPPEFRLLPTLPLLAGRDYEFAALTSPLVLDASRIDELQPLCLFPTNTEKTRWQHAELIGQSADLENKEAKNRRWSARVRIDPRDGAIWLETAGQLQHVIAETDFTPLPDEAEFDKYDYRDAMFTVAAAEDRYAEGLFPFAVAAGDQTLRTMRIWAGDQYRQDYLVPGTVLGVDPASGAIQRSATGGLIRDDTALLTNIAELAYQWYGVARQALTLKTYPNSAIQIGQIIRNIDPAIEGNAASIGTPVTSIQVSIPGGQGQTGPATMLCQTDFAALDALQFSPRG